MVVELVTKIIEFVEKISLKKVIILLFLIIFILWSFPLIDYYFYFNIRTNKRIETLQQITNLDIEKIKNNDILLEEYNNILTDIQEHGYGPNIQVNFNSIISNKVDGRSFLYKFLTGGFWCWIIIILSPFIYKGKLKDTIIAIFLFGFIGALLGLISTIIPTFFNPNINYFGVPIFQLLAIILIALYVSKKNKKKKDYNIN